MTRPAKLTNEQDAPVSQRVATIIIILVGAAAMTVLGMVVGESLIETLKDPSTFQAWVRLSENELQMTVCTKRSVSTPEKASVFVRFL